MGRLDGKVAVISGGARGQGRAHARTLAREGAKIATFDICDALKFPMTPPATLDDLEETKRLVENEDQPCLISQVDARDLTSLTAFANQTMAEFGRIDILVVNHGIWAVDKNSWELSEESWAESVDILLTGAWKVTKAFIPKIIEGGRGGAIVLTSSGNVYAPQPGAAAYVAAKTGLVGLMRVLAWELGEHSIRVNSVHPGATDTPMLNEGGTMERSSGNWPKLWAVDRTLLTGLPQPQPAEAISNGVLFLVSDESQYVTGVQLPIDSGFHTY